MSVCKGNYKGYLDYDCYDKLKYQFLERTDLSTSTGYSTFYESYEFLDADKKETLSDIFSELLRYLSNTHVFWVYDSAHSCNYISYLLYDDIRKKFGVFELSRFEIFQKFLQDLNKEHTNVDCVNELVHLGSDKFQKMLSLYNLYDLYRSVRQKDRWVHRSNLCNELGKLIYNYNGLDEKYYKNDANLRKLLDDLRHRIQHDTWLSNVICHEKLSNLQPIKTVPTETKSLMLKSEFQVYQKYKNKKKIYEKKLKPYQDQKEN
ncbi:hypothetical protein PCYB_006180 [Plasmodium cynomolgi strain B]|uniref:CYIR protein n=1 Tax=Plasmodium cynomolgi (strain B) TaxID=1120755 RepID=K6V0K9_PLACD|nr:hypothetical protein PCYB_006180 [Plasmodium cynomolgi strain B]GAB69869.1 hypothetical protein PCYB_006180 [Plasmodium cynomolgi strain B]